MTTRFDAEIALAEAQNYELEKRKQSERSTTGSRSSSVDSVVKVPFYVKNDRSDSYSSVREELDGLPQSFRVSSKRTSDPNSALGEYPDGDEAAIAEGPSESNRWPCPQASDASLGALPAEVLENILERLTLDVPPTEYKFQSRGRNEDLVACLLTSKKLYASAHRVLYRQVTFQHSYTFSKFMDQVRRDPELGILVRRLDLSHFTSLGMGRTQKLNSEIQNMTSKSLLECLKATPRIREVLLQLHVDQDVDTYVLLKLFYGLPKLEALDLCASSIANFTESFTNAVSRLNSHSSLTINLQRLCLHECSTLHSDSLELLLSRMPNITILDLHHTRVTDKALISIPHSARLTHLNVGRCPSLTADVVLDFLAHHPAASSLVWLSLSCHPSCWRLFNEDEVSALLPTLPSTLRSLNLNGAKITRDHIPALLPLTRHLEELSLAHTDLSLDNISTFFARPESSPENPSRDPTSTSSANSTWTPCTLHYLDLTGLTSLTQPALISRSNALLSDRSLPLEVIEVSAKIKTSLSKAKNTNEILGWGVKEVGRRSWYVRQQIGANADTGAREWKMGSRWWGMRKVPVAWSEVGGLFSHYMYKT